MLDLIFDDMSPLLSVCTNAHGKQDYRPSVFLAGPTNRNNDFNQSWRKWCVQLFEVNKFDGIVYIPEHSVPKPFDNSEYAERCQWEWKCMDWADCILFWVPRKVPEVLGLTTNLEFGTYLEKSPEKIVLGHPQDADEVEWMDIRYSLRTRRTACTALEETVTQAMHIMAQKQH